MMLHELNTITLNKIDFHKSAEDLADLYTYLSDSDKLKIQMVESKSTFDYIDNHNNYNCILLIELHEINSYKKVLDNNLISYICTDITKSVIDNDLDIEKYLRKYVNGSNIIEYNIFIKDVNEWIINNLELDGILDRINEKGIDNLREIDKKFLNKI